MLKFFKRIGYFLERSERNYPIIFWLCTGLLEFFLVHEPEPVKTSSQFHIVIEQVRGGGNYDSNSNAGFARLPPGQKSSGEQSFNSQDLKPVDDKIPTRVGYRTALSGGKKLPDNPGGGGSWGVNNQDNEFAWGKIQNDPEIWSRYQGYCQDQSKKNQQDLNSLAEQLRLGNKSPGIGTKTLFKGVKKARARSGARLYFRETNGKIEILAKSNKSLKDQKAVIKILRKKYG